MTALSVISTVSAATLDVKGEIKIDGKVVIDQQGHLITPDLVDINAYMKSVSGITTLMATDIAEESHTIVTTSDGLKNRSEFEYRNGELSWAGEWFDGELTRTQNPWNTCSPTNTLESLQWIPYPLMKVGSTGSNLSEYNIKSKSTCDDVVDKDKIEREIESMSLLAKTTYQQGGFDFDDCILVEQVRSWGRIDLKTFCLGQGFVAFVPDYRNNNQSNPLTYELTSVEALPADYVWEHKILTLNTEAEIDAANAQLRSLLVDNTFYSVDENDEGILAIDGITLNADGTLTNVIENILLVGETWEIKDGLLYSIEDTQSYRDRLVAVMVDYIVLEEVGENHDGPFRLYFEKSKAEAYMDTLSVPEVPVTPTPMPEAI